MAVYKWNLALVTGASSGIGKAVAKSLAANGTNLIIVARDEQRLQNVAERLRTAYGVEVEVLVADLSDDNQVQIVVDRLSRQDIPVDLLINNAGMGSHGDFDEADIEHEIKVVKLNIVALMRLAHAAGAAMAKRGIGHILNVSSIASFGPSPTVATYAATKAFVTSFSQAIAVELEPKGVVVSCVCPGLTKTEFQMRSNSDSNGVPKSLWLSPEEIAGYSLDGLVQHKQLYVPTVKYKIYTTLLKWIPARWIFKMNKKFKRK